MVTVTTMFSKRYCIHVTVKLNTEKQIRISRLLGVGITSTYPSLSSSSALQIQLESVVSFPPPLSMRFCQNMPGQSISKEF